MEKLKCIKNLLGCTPIAILTLLAVILLGKIVYPDPYDVNKIKSFHEMPEDSFDVIGLGSSHMLAAMNSRLMQDEFGIKSYNYGSDWQSIDTTELFLRDAFRTQKPKIVVIETYQVDSFKEDTSLDGETYYTREIKARKFDYLRKRFRFDLFSYAAYCFPLLEFHDKWNELSATNFTVSDQKEQFKKTLGQAQVETVAPIEIIPYEELEQCDISPRGIEYLDTIFDLCHENGAEVILITTPMQGYYPYIDALSEYASDKGAAYIDYFELVDELGIDGDTDFYDDSHLNMNGSEKVSRHLAQFILDNYDI